MIDGKFIDALGLKAIEELLRKIYDLIMGFSDRLDKINENLENLIRRD